MPRPSPVSDEVRRLLGAGDQHVWSIDDLHRAARSSLGSADYSSVFRAVNVLERQGVIERVDLGDGRTRYELRDQHHEHIRCDACGRIAEVGGCVLDGVAGEVQKQTGFTVTSHQVVFTGLCAECRSGAQQSGG